MLAPWVVQLVAAVATQGQILRVQATLLLWLCWLGTKHDWALWPDCCLWLLRHWGWPWLGLVTGLQWV